MSFDYAKSAATAQRLLARFGQRVTLKRKSAGQYDPVTGEETPGIEAVQQAAAVLLDYSYQGSGEQMAEHIRKGDKRILIEAKGLQWPPDALTLLEDASGGVWQLEMVRTLAPAGLPVMYEANGTR